MSVLRKGTYANETQSFFLTAGEPLPSLDISGNLIVTGAGAFGDGVVIPNGSFLSFTNASGDAADVSYPAGGNFTINVSGETRTTTMTLNPEARMLGVQGGVSWRSSGTANYPTTAQGGQVVWNQVVGGGGQTEFVNARGTGSGGFAFYTGNDNTAAADLSLAVFFNRDGMSIPPLFDMAKTDGNGSNITTFAVNGTQLITTVNCNSDSSKEVQTIMDASGKSFTLNLSGDTALQITDLGTRMALYKPTDAGNFVWGAAPTSLNLFDCSVQPAGVYRAELYTAEVGSTDSYATCIFGVNGAGQCSLISLGREPTGTWGGSGGQYLTWTTDGTYATTEALFMAQMINPA
jgi:hypothetical protein